MAQFNANIKLVAPNPLDDRYLSTRTCAGAQLPYSACTEVNTTIASIYRYTGLTVNIGGIEYWYKNGIGDGDLIEKLFTGGGTITGATNGLSIDGTNDKEVVLGGNLITGTTINGQGLYDLNLTNLNGFQVSTSGNTAQIILEPAGITLAYSGQSVSFDSNGGLTYDGNYCSGFTAQSLVDASYVTGHTANNFLKLDQTLGQTVINGMPKFEEGVMFGTTACHALISGHTRGKVYYDDCYEALTVQIGDESALQIGQENLTYVWNDSGSIIHNGAIVRAIGTHCGGGTCADVTSVCLAKADIMTCALAIGVATEEIGVNEYGFITTRGYVSDLNTTIGTYSGVTTSSLVYLSPTVAGGVTNTPPTAPNLQVHIGRLTTTGITGKLAVQIEMVYRLGDLSNVAVPSPTVDDVLKWNGLCWVNGTVGTTSAGSGVNFYYATPIKNSRTQPVGLDSTGTLGNGVAIYSLSKTPVTSGGTQYVNSLANGDTRAAVAWLYDTPLGRTIIDSGTWEFTAWLCVDAAGGTTTITNNMYQVVPITGSTITISGATANARRADITSGQFAGSYFTGSTVNTNASWLQTPSGIYQICAKVNNNRVCIVVPTGYVNETAVTGNTWNKLFGVASPDINDLVYTCCVVTLAEPSFAISCTDKLGRIGYVGTTACHCIAVSYNGNTQASYFKTPLITLHNDLAGLQGGTGIERFHTTCAQNQLLAGITASASEINVLDGIPPTLSSTELGYVDGVTSPIQTQLDNKLDKSIGITGATNVGAGTTVYSGTTNNELVLSTIKGSGGTTVQKVGQEIVINSVTASGSQLYSGQTPSAVNLCGITVGYQLTGKTVSQILQDLLVPELFQTSVGTPSTSVGATYSGIMEIGCSVSQTITPTYTAGAVTPLYCTTSPYCRGGAANNYSYSGPSVSTGFNGCTSCVINPYIVTSGAQTWNVCTRYNVGACIKGSKGTVNPSYPTVCPQDSCTAAGSVSITGILPWFWGTKSSGTITASDITGGTKTLAVVGASTPITFNATTQYLWFAAPTGTYTTKTKWWVCAANAGNIGGTGELWKQQGTVSVTCGSKWAGCSFDVYVTCGITTTASGIPMCLYY